MAFYNMKQSASLLRPSSILTVTLFAFVVAIFLATLVDANPVPENKGLDDLVNAVKNNDDQYITTDDGKTYKISTRDIILIVIGALLLLLIFTCCIGYCLCECFKTLICCIFCCE